MGTYSKPVSLPMARLPGRKYEKDKPGDCRYCYYWARNTKTCRREECWYLIPDPVVPEKKPERNSVPLLNCSTCAYGRIEPCIGYCIARIERDIFSRTRGWKTGADTEQRENIAQEEDTAQGSTYGEKEKVGSEHATEQAREAVPAMETALLSQKRTEPESDPVHAVDLGKERIH